MGEKMDVQTLIIWLIVGAIAGWLAGMVVKGGGYGLIGDIIVGIIGGFIAGWLLPRLGIAIGGGFLSALLHALLRAVLFLLIFPLVKRAALAAEAGNSVFRTAQQAAALPDQAGRPIASDAGRASGPGLTFRTPTGATRALTPQVA